MNYYNYFTEIEETFIRRRGRNLLLSPLDWALIEAWQERGVPLHIVLSGIEKVFDTLDRQPGRQRSVKSLLYCKEEIEAQYAEWLERQVGKSPADADVSAGAFELEEGPSDRGTRHSADGGPGALVEAAADGPPAETAEPRKSDLFPPDAIAAHLEKVLDGLRLAIQEAPDDLRETLVTAARRVAEAAKNYRNAEALEETLESLDALIDKTLLKTCETGELRKRVAGEMSSYRTKMEEDVFDRTVELMLLKRLREEMSIPRLSLFDL